MRQGEGRGTLVNCNYDIYCWTNCTNCDVHLMHGICGGRNNPELNSSANYISCNHRRKTIKGGRVRFYPLLHIFGSVHLAAVVGGGWKAVPLNYPVSTLLSFEKNRLRYTWVLKKVTHQLVLSSMCLWLKNLQHYKKNMLQNKLRRVIN